MLFMIAVVSNRVVAKYRVRYFACSGGDRSIAFRCVFLDGRLKKFTVVDCFNATSIFVDRIDIRSLFFCVPNDLILIDQYYMSSVFRKEKSVFI